MRANANRFYDGPDFIRTAEHDYIQTAIELHQLLERVQTVHFRHKNVEDNEIRPLTCIHLGKGLLAGAHGLHFEIIDLQQRLQILPYARFIIDYQDFFFLGHQILLMSHISQSSESNSYVSINQFWSMGSRNVNLLPPTGSLCTHLFPRCAWINRFAIASPNPIPVVLRSTRTKSSKISW